MSDIDSEDQTPKSKNNIPPKKEKTTPPKASVKVYKSGQIPTLEEGDNHLFSKAQNLPSMVIKDSPFSPSKSNKTGSKKLNLPFDLEEKNTSVQNQNPLKMPSTLQKSSMKDLERKPSDAGAGSRTDKNPKILEKIKPKGILKQSNGKNGSPKNVKDNTRKRYSIQLNVPEITFNKTSFKDRKNKKGSNEKSLNEIQNEKKGALKDDIFDITSKKYPIFFINNSQIFSLHYHLQENRYHREGKRDPREAQNRQRIRKFFENGNWNFRFFQILDS